MRRLVGTCRFIYNKLTAFGKEQSIVTGHVPPLKVQTDYLKSLETEFPWIADVHSKVRQQSRIDYNMAWSKFFRDLQTGNRTVTAGHHNSVRFFPIKERHSLYSFPSQQ